MLESEPIIMYTEEMSLEGEPVFESYKEELAPITKSLSAKIAGLETVTASNHPLYSTLLPKAAEILHFPGYQDPITQAQSDLHETRNRLAILQEIDDLEINGNSDGDWHARIHIRKAGVIDTIYLMRRFILEYTWEGGYSYPVYSGGGRKQENYQEGC